MTAAEPGDTALAREFEKRRPRLLRLAYATTGSLAEAEDCVQEAWLRLQRVPDRAAIRDPQAWLTTTVSRIALDVLGSARMRRVHSEVVGRSPAAVRQLAARARRHVQEGRPRFPPTRTQQRELLAAFTSACTDGDLDRLLPLLDPDVVWRADGGGKVTATPGHARGAAQVARLLLGYGRRRPYGMRTALVNGAPGLVVRDSDGVLSVIALTVDGGRFTAIDVIRNPDKLAGVRG